MPDVYDNAKLSRETRKCEISVVRIKTVLPRNGVFATGRGARGVLRIEDPLKPESGKRRDKSVRCWRNNAPAARDFMIRACIGHLHIVLPVDKFDFQRARVLYAIRDGDGDGDGTENYKA